MLYLLNTGIIPEKYKSMIDSLPTKSHTEDILTIETGSESEEY